MTQDADPKLFKGSIAWMAGNSVTANLMMAVLLIGGLFMGFNIKQEVFPEFSLDIVNISIAYPGASPEEVENGILLATEEWLVLRGNAYQWDKPIFPRAIIS